MNAPRRRRNNSNSETRDSGDAGPPAGRPYTAYRSDDHATAVYVTADYPPADHYTTSGPSDTSQLDMSCRDRTSEFLATVKSMQSRQVSMTIDGSSQCSPLLNMTVQVNSVETGTHGDDTRASTLIH